MDSQSVSQSVITEPTSVEVTLNWTDFLLLQVLIGPLATFESVLKSFADA